MTKPPPTPSEKIRAMSAAEAAGVLREYNDWRRAVGKYALQPGRPSLPCPYCTYEIGRAIELGIEALDKEARP